MGYLRVKKAYIESYVRSTWRHVGIYLGYGILKDYLGDYLRST